MCNFRKGDDADIEYSLSWAWWMYLEYERVNGWMESTLRTWPEI
jgi:hypothetical protein